MVIGGEVARLLRWLGCIKVDPWDPRCVMSGGFQFSLHNELLVPVNGNGPLIVDPRDPTKQPKYENVIIGPEGYHLPPGGFVLGATHQRLTLPWFLNCRVDGRSTNARLGVTPHQAAMNLWAGHGAKKPRRVTLEIKNESETHTIVLHHGWIIAQLVFEVRLGMPWSYDKGGRYSDDDGVMAPVLKGDEDFIL